MKMKNKKAEQEADRIAAKERLRQSKRNKRFAEPVLDREKAHTEEKKSFLIVCEGENTEKSYFEQFRIPNAEITAIGTGYNTISLVNYTYKIVNQKKNNGQTFDQVWCVFDKDDFNTFDEAIELARQYGFYAAHSNQAFEYWLILHFNDHQGGAMPRTDYGKQINSAINPLGANYDADGSKTIDDKFFTILQSIDPKTHNTRQSEAIKRAKRNHINKQGMKASECESNTTVYLLVEEILPSLTPNN